MKPSLKLLSLVILVILPLLFSQCRNNSLRGKTTDSVLVDQSPDTLNKAIAIFYKMLLPGEMSQLFEKAGAVYNSGILNPVERIPLYTTSAKASLNMGVYGVDLGYAKMFNQTQVSMKYFNAIHDLSKQIGIPEEYFSEGISYFQNKIVNRDTITDIANNIFSSAQEYLEKNDREEVTALIILGGWVEALYVSSTILRENKQNKAIIDRIAGQKYSLNSLINYLGNYSKDMTVAKYLLMLKALKKPYEDVSIMFDEKSTQMDTIKKTIHSDSYKVEVAPETLDAITSLIKDIRMEIVN